jgi:DNA-binding transcriptional regulator GbsR (MarR family)
MGTRWGINRTVAQVYALLYLSPEPLNAQDIEKSLSVARSNVSTSLRELQEVRRLPSDRLRQIVKLRGKLRKLLTLGLSDRGNDIEAMTSRRL